MKYLVTLLIGLVLGAGLAFYFLVGAPRVRSFPGEAVKAPEASGDAPGTAVVVLDEKFFDALLGAIFSDLNKPTFPLQIAAFKNNERMFAFGDAAPPVRFDKAALQSACQNQVVITNEAGGVKTSVRFANNKIEAPLAFDGSYNVPLFGCAQFKGSALANIGLRFDAAKQTLNGHINVEGVNLEGAPPIASGVVTALVQQAINERINPLQVLRAPQLQLAIPVQASNGTLNAHVTDVRSEVKDNALRLHITYSFNGARGQ